MLYRKEAYTTTGTKGSINLDPSIADFRVTVAVTVGNSATFGMQYSLDPMSVSDANALWFDSTDIPAGSSASEIAVLTAPVSRIRFVVAAVSGTLSVQVLQGISVN